MALLAALKSSKRSERISCLKFVTCIVCKCCKRPSTAIWVARPQSSWLISAHINRTLCNMGRRNNEGRSCPGWTFLRHNKEICQRNITNIWKWIFTLLQIWFWRCVDQEHHWQSWKPPAENHSSAHWMFWVEGRVGQFLPGRGRKRQWRFQVSRVGGRRLTAWFATRPQLAATRTNDSVFGSDGQSWIQIPQRSVSKGRTY